MSFNVWGLPKAPILDLVGYSSQYKKERMEAIAKEVSKGEYDVYLFQELWTEKDYKVIKAHLPDGYHMTNFQDFNEQSPKCGIQHCLPLCKFLTCM